MPLHLYALHLGFSINVSEHLLTSALLLLCHIHHPILNSLLTILSILPRSLIAFSLLPLFPLLLLPSLDRMRLPDIRMHIFLILFISSFDKLFNIFFLPHFISRLRLKFLQMSHELFLHIINDHYL